MSAEKNDARGQAGRRGDQGMKTTGRILAFPPRRRFCSGCGISFRPLHVSHSLCRVCYAWARVAFHVCAIRRLMREAR